jgi:hypothetical protein
VITAIAFANGNADAASQRSGPGHASSVTSTRPAVSKGGGLGISGWSGCHWTPYPFPHKVCYYARARK